MKNLIATASLASVLILSSSAVLAKDYRDHGYDDDHYYERNHSDRGYDNKQMARVVRVEPIYRTVRVSEPVRDCYRSNDRHSRTNSYTSTIAGGIIGGVLGNQFGKGSGNTALTVAGTLLGGSVGRDLGQTSRVGRHYQRDQSCHVTQRYHNEQQLDGYHVTYRYKGQTYSTQTDRHPGKYIPVTVNVTPAYRHHY